MYTKLTMKNS